MANVGRKKIGWIFKISMKWEVIGAPYNRGSSHKGSKDAPAAIRAAGLTRRVDYLTTQGFTVADGGDVLLENSPRSDASPKGGANLAAYAESIKRLNQPLLNGTVPIIIGGDHSISIATLSAVCSCPRQTTSGIGNVGVVWIDAHPDLESPGPDSTDGLDAMAAAHLLGHGLPGLCTLAEVLAPR